MAALTAPRGLPLWSDHLRFMRRHRAWIGGLMGLGLLLGYAWSLTQPASFSASASVALVPVPMYVTSSTTEVLPPAVSIDTDAQLLQSPRVLGAIADVLGTDEATAGRRLAISASPNSHVLNVAVSAGSPAKAAAAANAAISAFVQVRRHALGALKQDQLSQLRLLIADQERLLSKTMVVDATSIVFTQVLDLQTRLQELEDARSQPAEIVSPAVAPRRASHANTEVPAVSGAMLGLLLGWLLGATRDLTAAARIRVRAASPLIVSNPFGDLHDAVAPHESCHHAVS